MVHYKTARTNVRGSGFQPQFNEPDATRYRAQLRSVADGILDRDDSWIADLSSYAAAPTAVRGDDPLTARSVVNVIRRSKAIDVKYQSLTGPEPRWRCIAPHAIAFDGFRWPPRALCLMDDCFSNFLMSRVIEIRGAHDSEASPADDREWHSEVTLEVGTHPDLSETQAKVIALDYGM